MIDDAVAVVVRNLRVRRVSHGAGHATSPRFPSMQSVRLLPIPSCTATTARWLAGIRFGSSCILTSPSSHSPGGLWGGQSIDSIYSGQSRSRNPILARLLTDVPFHRSRRTVAANAGSGIPRMLGQMTQNGLPAPRFSSVPAEFVTVLDRFGLLNPETRDWLDSLGHRIRTPIGDSALALIHHLRFRDRRRTASATGDRHHRCAERARRTREFEPGNE